MLSRIFKTFFIFFVISNFILFFVELNNFKKNILSFTKYNKKESPNIVILTGGTNRIKDGLKIIKDFGKLQKERTIDLDVRCSITMEDGSELYIFYGGKMIFDKKSDKLNEEGKILTPKNGLAYWVSAPLIRTSSEKYDYMNDIQRIGIGRNAKMAPPITATYDLYKIVY